MMRHVLRCTVTRSLAAVVPAMLAIALLWTTACSQSSTRDRAQTRDHGRRVAVVPGKVNVDDGDTIEIRWGRGDSETIRILGIDTPETRHVAHNLPYDQPFGEEAKSFARGVFAAAQKVELLRADQVDPFGRTLGYVFVDGENYSVMVVRARLAVETVSHYGDNGFPREADAVLAAARAAGPVPFEPPHLFRRRMREVSDWMREKGLYPQN